MQWTGKPASLKAATFLGAVALLGFVGLLRAVDHLGQDVLYEDSSRVLWQHLDGLDSLLKPVSLAASASQPEASRTKSSSRSSCESPFVLRIGSISDLSSIGAELANAGIDLFKSSGFSNNVKGIASWYQPQLARFLCKDTSVQDWHERYGNASEYDQLCAARTSSIVRSTWTHATMDPVFRLSPTLKTGWPVLYFGTGTGPGIIVQHEGAIRMREGLALQGANCCYCEAFLEMHDAESSCACLNEQFPCALAQHQKVFSIAQVFGYGYAHFVKEVLPRLVPFAGFLRANKDIKIHVKTLHDGPPGHFVNDFLGLLGLDPARVIYGDVVAQEAWIPLWTTCGMASAQHSLLLATRDLVWRAAGRDDNGAPLVIVIERRAGTRTWKSIPDRYEALATAVRQGVPAHGGHVIARLRDDNEDLLQCVACQVRLFRRADIVIGMHGAGLSNALFMPSGGLVVELGWPGQQTEYTVLSHVLGHRYVLYDAEKIARDAWTGLTRILAEHFATMGHVGSHT